MEANKDLDWIDKIFPNNATPAFLTDVEVISRENSEKRIYLFLYFIGIMFSFIIVFEMILANSIAYKSTKIHTITPEDTKYDKFCKLLTFNNFRTNIS